MQRINPFDDVVVPDDPISGEIVIRLIAAPVASDLREQLIDTPTLELDDVIGLTTMAVNRLIGPMVFARGKLIRRETSRRGATISIRIVAAAFWDFMPDGIDGTIWLGDRVNAWIRDHAHLRRGVDEAVCTPRQFIISEFQTWIDESMGPERDARGANWVALHALESLGQNVNEAGGPQDLTWADARTALFSVRRDSGGFPGAVYRGQDGKFRLGLTQIRDRISSAYKISRKAKRPKRALDSIEDTVDLPFVDGRDQPERDGMEIAQALRDFQASKVAHAEKNRNEKERAVLSYLEAKLIDGMPEGEVAKRTGAHPSYVHKVLHKAGVEFATKFILPS